MKRIALGLVILLLAAVLAAGLIVYFSNPFSTSKPDYSATFAQSIGGAGWSPIHPISQVAENAYSGLYRTNSGNSSGNRSGNESVTVAVTIEIAQSQDAAKDRYQQLVLEKQSAGYASGNSELNNSTVFGDPTASWFGYNDNNLSNVTTYLVLYAYNTEISNWVVVAESTGLAT